MRWVAAMKRSFMTFVLCLTAFIVCAPVVLTLLASVKSGWELEQGLVPVLLKTGKAVRWRAFAQYPTLRHYVKLLLETPQFFTVFWNSVRMVVLILVGQAVISIPAAWAFAKFQFRAKRVLFLVYITLMLMPFQVTMLPSYLVLDDLGLMNTQWAVILPAIFGTLPVFLMYRGFTAIPQAIIEAAQMDGAGDAAIFLRIGIPLGMPGILSALVLGFLEYWNMMEQPLAFIHDRELWPLSLYLPEVGISQAGDVLAASVVALIPAAFVFVIGSDYLEQGIVASGIKE